MPEIEFNIDEALPELGFDEEEFEKLTIELLAAILAEGFKLEDIESGYFELEEIELGDID